MKQLFNCAILLALSTVLLGGCKSSKRRTSKDWRPYQARNYSRIESNSEKVPPGDTNIEALNGAANVKYGLPDYKNAESFFKREYDLNRTSLAIYDYARITNLNGRPNQAMNLLFELANRSDFEIYRQLAYNSNDFGSLRDNIKFKRYLSGYRRLKIIPYEAYSNDEDMILGLPYNENELFITISNNNQLILSTKYQQDKNHVFFKDTVVFDYKLGSTIEMNLMDEDVWKHDKLVSVSRTLTTMGDFTFRGNGYMKIKISDTEERPHTTGLRIPSERDLQRDLLLAAGATAGIIALANLDMSLIIRFLNCAASYEIGSMKNSDIVAEATRRVIQNRGSAAEIGLNAFTKYLVSELRANNHPQLAEAVQAGVFISCILGGN